MLSPSQTKVDYTQWKEVGTAATLLCILAGTETKTEQGKQLNVLSNNFRNKFTGSGKTLDILDASFRSNEVHAKASSVL